MSLTVGELQVLLSGDPSKLNRELDRIDSRAGQTEKTWTGAWKRIAVTAGAAIAAIGIGALAADTAKLGIEYRNQLNTLSAVSGATAEQMAAVGRTAKTLGSDLTLPATSAADAAAVMTELAKASFTVEESQQAAKGSLQLAAAAQIEGARAATIQASALQAFNLKASDAGRVADVLANSANASSAEITDVADALAQAGAVASAANISIEDTAATIGILANNGIRGSDAGTLLKSALLALRDTSKPAQAAMDALNLSVYDAQGNFVGLESIFGDLAEAQSTMSQEAFEAATNVLFGSDASRLAGIAAKTGAEGFDQMRDAMSRQGAAADVAAAKAKGLGGALEGFKSQVETLQIQGFEALEPAMEAVVRKASDMVPVFGTHLFGAMEKAIGAAQELHEEFGPELSQIAAMAATKWDQFVDVAKRLSEELAPSLPSVADALLRIAEVGMDVGAGMLPVLHAAIDAVGPVSEAVAGTLNLVAGALEAIEPILPAVVTGFLAFRGIAAVNGLLTGFSGGVKSLSDRMSTGAINAGVFTEKLTRSTGAGEKVMTGMGKAAGAITRVGSALPVVGLAVAAVGYAFEKHAQQVEADTQALIDNLHAQDQGGQIAIDGTKALDAHRKKVQEAQAAYDASAASAGHAANGAAGYGAAQAAAASKLRELKKALADATGEYEKHQAAMTPVERAQERVTAATNDLLQAQEDFGVGSPEAVAAAETRAAALGHLEQKQRDLAAATGSATDKLLAQTQAAMAGANADLAASMAQTQLTTATETYNTSLADGTLTTTQRTQAADAMTAAAYSTAQALSAQALAHSTAATDEGKQADADAALLASLQETAKQLGINTPAAISDLIVSLQKSSAAAATSKMRMEELGLSVVEIPNEKSVIIKAPTEDQRKRLQDLGYAVTNIPGSKNVVVTADTSPAARTLAALVARNYTINVRAVMPDLNGAVSGSGRMGTAATGGPINPGMPWLVGEEGPEIIFPTQAGFVATAKQTAALLSATGNARAASMLPTSAAAMSGGRGSPAGGSAGTGSASVGGVTEKHYHSHATVTQALTPREFINLTRETDALYG